LNQVITGTSNTAFGSGAGGAPYGITIGSENVIIGAGAGAGNSCSNGSNSTFLGSNTTFKPGVGYYNELIALGAKAVITNYNQLIVASNVTAFNMAGLAPSTGTSTGTWLATSYPQQGHTRLSRPLTLPLPQLMTLTTFGSLPQLYQAQRPPPQPLSTTLSHGVV